MNVSIQDQNLSTNHPSSRSTESKQNSSMNNWAKKVKKWISNDVDFKKRLRELSSDSDEEKNNVILIDLIGLENPQIKTQSGTLNASPSLLKKTAEINKDTKKLSRRCRRTPRNNSEASLTLEITEQKLKGFESQIKTEFTEQPAVACFPGSLQITHERKSLNALIQNQC